MNFFAQFKRSSSHGSRHQSARSGVYSHRSAKESVGRRVHADSHSTSRNYDSSSGRSSRLGSGRNSRIGVGTVLVMLQETPASPGPPPLRELNKEGKTIPKDHFFVAIAAPDNDQALAFLAVQPAGTFVLVKQSADDLAVYIKFQAAVRSFTVVNGKTIKRAKSSDELIEWGRSYRPLAVHTPHAEALLAQPTLMTPVHRLYLPPAEFAHLERCWLHFLPQVQAIAFELCTQPYYMDEEIAMDDWDQIIVASRVPCVAFLSVDSCGFHLFNTAAAASLSLSSDGSTLGASATAATATIAVPIRVVEFDISKCLISIADGIFRPRAIVSPVHFGAAKLYDAALGFTAIRESFLSPDRVTLKEATANNAGVPQWSDVLNPTTAAIDGDAELQLMLAMRSLVAAVVPHEPLPEGLLDALSRLHTFWTAQPSTVSCSRWRTPAKLQCAAQLLPFYVELLLATATTHPYVMKQNLPHSTLLPTLAASLRTDIRVLAQRADDASVARLVHHVLQALALRASVPPMLVMLVSDLCIESTHFRRLFLRNQGSSLLWTAIHTAVALAPCDPAALTLLLQQQQQPSHRGMPLLSELTKRRSSLFGSRRKSQHTRGSGNGTGNGSGAGTRRSFAFNASIVLPVTLETTVQVFFRLNPLHVQLELASSSSVPRDFPVELSPLHTPSPSTLGAMAAFLQRLACLLMAEPTSPTREKDALQLLRMDNLYEHLYHALVAGIASGEALGTAESSDDVETVLACIADLYRLETKRRRHAGPNISEKKYWFLFHLLRNPIRAFHEHLRERKTTPVSPSTDTAVSVCESESDAVADDISMGSSSSTTTASATASLGFAVLARVLPRLPRQMVTEFVLVSLDDLLQALRVLHEYLQRRPSQSLHGVARHVRLVLTILTTVLQRTCDFDLQLLLVRVLASSGSAVPAMVLRLVKESASHGHGHAVEREVLTFAEAFVTLATALSQLETWHATRDAVYYRFENSSDVDGNEQRKTMLMATVLSPENGVADSDEFLWDTLQAILVPVYPIGTGPTYGPRLGVVERFYSKAVFTQWDAPTTVVPHSIRKNDVAQQQAVMQYLRVRARVFLSTILETPGGVATTQLRGFVEFHWDYLYDLREQFKCQRESGVDDAPSQSDLALLHLQCLMALASRRGQLPELDEAFLDFRTARELLRILQLGTTHSQISRQSEASTTDGVVSGLSLNLSQASSHLTTDASPALDTTTELLLSSPTLHAATLLTILACTLSEPHALNEKIVPRFFLPSNIDGSSLHLLPDEDLLLSLQRHLRVVDSPALRAAIRSSLHDAEVDQHVGGPARAHAVRVLVRLLLPDSYDAHLYTRVTGTAASTNFYDHCTMHADDSDDEGRNSDDDDQESQVLATTHPRTYIARGAFATVYRATPCVGTSDVAIKVCAFQRSSGELCVAAEVFNEVVVLERLRGNLAATQLVDYGNNTKESLGLELVLEHCPASLAQWRRSLNLESDAAQVAAGTPPPFRTLLGLTLGVFLEVARAVAQIHASQVCHFDIKADNVLLRVDPPKMTAELLHEQKGNNNHIASTLPRVCLADFGESAVMSSPGQPLQLTRTRGTEAIKSPEMLSVLGGQPTRGTLGHSVGPASDVWSLGCLLFELITEDVMFANDDWAHLYAHLVAPTLPSASVALPVVRDDLQQKLVRVLAPSNDAETGLTSVFLQFLESILTRDAHRRPTLDKLIDETEAQRRMILSLPSQPSDDAFHTAVLARSENSPSTRLASVVNSVSPASLAHLRKSPPSTGFDSITLTPLTGRLFFNFFLARDARAMQAAATNTDTAMPTPRENPSISGDTAQTPVLTDAQLRHELSVLPLAMERRFSHVIYFCYDDVKRPVAHDIADGTSVSSAADATHARAPTADDAFLEIVEGVGRTVFYFSRARVLACLQSDHATSHQTTSVATSMSSARGHPPTTIPTPTSTAEATNGGLSLVRLLLQQSRCILATLQRHLRHQSGRVLIVPVDFDGIAVTKPNNNNTPTKTTKTKTDANGSPLGELTTATLLFFLTTSLALSPLEVIASFSRECHALLALPSARVLTQLLLLYDARTAAIDAVVSIEHSLHGRACVHCRCGDKVLAVSTSTLINSDDARFVPPHVDIDVDAEIVWDPCETALVGGGASAPRSWVVVDTLAVDRLASVLRVVLQRLLGVAAPTTAAARGSGGHRTSQGQLTSRHAHGNADDVASALRDHVPILLHGLSEMHSPITMDAAWTLYECSQCGTRVCAINTASNKLALPL